MAFPITPSRRTRQPQGHVGLASEFMVDDSLVVLPGVSNRAFDSGYTLNPSYTSSNWVARPQGKTHSGVVVITSLAIGSLIKSASTGTIVYLAFIPSDSSGGLQCFGGWYSGHYGLYCADNKIFFRALHTTYELVNMGVAVYGHQITLAVAQHGDTLHFAHRSTNGNAGSGSIACSSWYDEATWRNGADLTSDFFGLSLLNDFTLYSAAESSLFAYFPAKVCADAELISLADNPFSIFVPDPRILYFDLGRPKGTMRPTVRV